MKTCEGLLRPILSNWSGRLAVTALVIMALAVVGVSTTLAASAMSGDGVVPTVLGGAIDRTAPTCTLTAVVSGPPTSVEITIQDRQSGIDTIIVMTAINARVHIHAFTPGTNDPVAVTATKIDHSQRARVTLVVTDVAGNETVCDPVITLEIREDGKPVTHTFTDIPQDEHWVRVENGTPGLKNLDVVVNGEKFKIAGLGDDSQKILDIIEAMVGGDNNTITLTAYGKPGASAMIIIGDASVVP